MAATPCSKRLLPPRFGGERLRGFSLAAATFAAVALMVGFFAISAAAGASRSRSLWDLKALKIPPSVQWGGCSNEVRELFYEGPLYNGRPTRVYAFLGMPKGAKDYANEKPGKGPFPAIVLVHGGGGKAFPDWAQHWANSGYVALAMDLAGCGPSGRLPDGGPGQDDDCKFRNFTMADARDMWTYHAVANVIRGHSLLASLPQVDSRRIAITGISWGGYLTCIVAGLDHRLKAAVPVYGCGFIHENSVWLDRFAKMTSEQKDLWTSLFDPSSHLGGVRCPILFLNSPTDFAYPPDSYKKSYSLVSKDVSVSLQIGLPHGHIWTFGEVDAFIDAALVKGRPLPRLSAMKIRSGEAVAVVKGGTPVVSARLCYTTDTGPWQRRLWKSDPATIDRGRIKAAVPPVRPIVCQLSASDERGLTVTTPHVVIE